MFNDRFGLTDAVLKGRKTMTRRIIRKLSDFDSRLDWMHWSYNGKANLAIIHIDTYKCCIYPQYQLDEVVAVAQNYNDVYEDLKRTHCSSSSVTREFYHKYVQGGRMPVNNKMFVRAALMPHQIRITDIKVERLQDISDENCLKEGITYDSRFWVQGYKVENLWNKADRQSHFRSAQAAFAALIDKISGKGTWERNPYVFAYTFELVK